MKTKELILKEVQKKGVIRTSDVVRLTKISRQGAAKHLRELVAEGKLLKEGSTHNAKYLPFSKSKTAQSSREKPFSLTHRLKGLEEDKVFSDMARKLSLKRKLSDSAFSIVNYAFSEMLNNAIDHSKGLSVRVEVRFANGSLEFEIRDKGIGTFESVRKKFKLKNHLEAAEHVLKGKQTTAPAQHSGQGIFFTSRIADQFALESRKLKLDVNNEIHDVGLVDVPWVRGARVTFRIKRKSKKNLKALFDEYSNSEYEFDKTEIKIRLTKPEGDYVSRSEAKRLLFGLEKFKRIVIDFKGVAGVGQGFADEIFRVFQKARPQIQIEPINMLESVAFMVKRANAKKFTIKKN
jgi:anti-sigma regulatory factor (Ser/Thr protein kinase)